MIKRSFFGLKSPVLQSDALEGTHQPPVPIQTPKRVTLLLDSPPEEKEALSLKEGDAVKTGQEIATLDGSASIIATVTGTISALTPFTGDFGRRFTAISIDTADDEPDDAFGAASKDPDLDTAQRYLAGAPGCPDFSVFSDPDTPIKTIIIAGVDDDLLVATQQTLVETRMADLKTGIELLKKITGVANVVLAVSRDRFQNYGDTGATVCAVDLRYPATRPHEIIRTALGQPVPAGEPFRKLGVAFLKAEAVIAVTAAFKEGRVPVTKMVTVIKKDGSTALAEARIGTPVGDLFKAFEVDVNDKERIILGGPMTGAAIYSEAHPIGPDTDALMVQDAGDIPHVSDYPCINCGQCIRICPAKVPVNMLVRFLEFGQYEEAADSYDLHACIECGLCAYVCVSKIPIFQYIRLAKYELGRTQTEEATDA